jgi:ureidoacrylate peracid hydrolase
MTTNSDNLLVTLEQKVAPGNAALVVIDVQNDFVADDGFFGRIGADTKTIQKSIPPLVRLIDRAREAGVLVVFVQAIYDAEYVSPAMRERNMRRKVEMDRCITGTWGADFYGVKPAPGEPVVIKHRYSAVPNTELIPLLQKHNIRSLLLTGVSTDTCVESTGRDAYFVDYYVSMVSDCCAAYSDSDHTGALKRFDRDYGSIATSAEVIDAWARLGQSGRAAPAQASR